MTLTNKMKTIIGISIVILTGAIVIPSVVVPITSKTVSFSLLYNAGIMIETRGVRIYVDPIDLPENYSDLPADIVLITHPHGDHYQEDSIELIQKEDTLLIFPNNMSEEIEYFGATGVDPEDQITFKHLTITAYYMYTLPVGTFPASHPEEANWTSYIIDTGSFTIFHAGDSKNIAEYENISGTIDLALLPLGPGCQTMTDLEVCDALEVIQPTYFTPVHYGEGTDVTFINTYSEFFIECEIVHLSYWTSTKFR